MSTHKDNETIDSAVGVIRYFAPAFVVQYRPGHLGVAWYVWSEDYPDDGAVWLGSDPGLVRVAALIVAYEVAAEQSEF